MSNPIPVAEKLTGSTHVKLSIDYHPNNFILVDNIHDELMTCHRSVPLTDKFLCYAFDGFSNITEYEMRIGPQWGDKIRRTTIPLPHFLHYEPYIASYADHTGKNRLWVKNRLNWFFNFNIAKAKARRYERVSPLKYEIKDEHDFKTMSSDIIYADAGGIVTKRCYDYLITGCLYRYSIMKENPMTSLCLYDERYRIHPGVVFKSWPTATTPAPDELETMGEYGYREAKSDWPLAYVPIQILAVITFVYLCFFFFFAFRPHPSSNLVELSVIMEDELIRLSILTSEAVKSMKAAQSKKLPPLILMRQPEDPTQESLEDVCCPGTTCKTVTNILEKFPRRELAPISTQRDAAPNDKIGESGANARSQTHTNKMLKTKTGPLPISSAPQRQVKTPKPTSKMLGKKPSSAEKLALHAPRRSAERILPMHDLVAPTYLPPPDQGRQRSVKARKATRLQ
ncbi:hypothetical protein Y032_0365g3574 [Ancylostoma ceylanicum]|uniref:Uncharacterized protein n=1 Tax=Ancylostoma ceylanicum TaxID=53326 RepID=A0A016RV32_9BILA|nr:hypothetical protein Y032_0365g3574 [Ancylostoma ceylanicum]